MQQLTNVQELTRTEKRKIKTHPWYELQNKQMTYTLVAIGPAFPKNNFHA